MQLYPAIDLRDGRCVRLYQGDFDRETVYGDDPVAQARSFADAGSEWIHVVDLDAARTGDPLNREVVGAICAWRDGQVQTGGGVRDEAAARPCSTPASPAWWSAPPPSRSPTWCGASRPRTPARWRWASMPASTPGRRRMTTGGRWRCGAGNRDRGATCSTVAREFDHDGVAALIVTEIGRDGTLAGPDLDGLARVLAATRLDVIASGGVGGLDDIRRLAALDVDGRHAQRRHRRPRPLRGPVHHHRGPRRRLRHPRPDPANPCPRFWVRVAGSWHPDTHPKRGRVRWR